MKLKAYVSVTVGGLVLAAAALLVILQWANVAEFSVYGYNLSVNWESGPRPTGGINTALLILCSAVGGVALWWLIRVVWSGFWAIRRARQAEEKLQKTVESRVAKESEQSQEG